jgi:hypothetical protein
LFTAEEANYYLKGEIHFMAKRTSTKQAVKKKATQKATPVTKPVITAQAGMMTTDIRKDYKKTLLGRFTGVKESRSGKRI